MSTPTTEVAKPDIVQAASAGDIVRAAKVDPTLKADLLNGLLAAIKDKSLIGTRTFWVTLLTPAVSYVATRYVVPAVGITLDEATCAEIATGLTVLASWAMRYVTKTPVASVLPASGGVATP